MRRWSQSVGRSDDIPSQVGTNSQSIFGRTTVPKRVSSPLSLPCMIQQGGRGTGDAGLEEVGLNAWKMVGMGPN